MGIEWFAEPWRKMKRPVADGGRFRKRIAEYAKRIHVLKRNGLEWLRRGGTQALSLWMQVVDSISRESSKRAVLSVFW
jgi:hypothetical protein